jgi:hypothetical protein
MKTRTLACIQKVCPNMLYLLIIKIPIRCCFLTYIKKKNIYIVSFVFFVCILVKYWKKQTWNLAHLLEVVDNLEATNNRVVNYNQEKHNNNIPIYRQILLLVKNTERCIGGQ